MQREENSPCDHSPGLNLWCMRAHLSEQVVAPSEQKLSSGTKFLRGPGWQSGGSSFSLQVIPKPMENKPVQRILWSRETIGKSVTALSIAVFTSDPHNSPFRKQGSCSGSYFSTDTETESQKLKDLSDNRPVPA